MRDRQQHHRDTKIYVIGTISIQDRTNHTMCERERERLSGTMFFINKIRYQRRQCAGVRRDDDDSYMLCHFSFVTDRSISLSLPIHTLSLSLFPFDLRHKDGTLVLCIMMCHTQQKHFRTAAHLQRSALAARMIASYMYTYPPILYYEEAGSSVDSQGRYFTGITDVNPNVIRQTRKHPPNARRTHVREYFR